MEKKTLNIILLLGMIAGIALCFWKIVIGEATNTEVLLLSLILTILSILGSWIVSSFYSEYAFDKNLRTFALKASEKVNNLSNELDRLSVYLQQELETNDYKSIEETLLARDIRIESAIHIIYTLKSVNDRSLSDWQGVIGDELNAQKEKREDDMRKLVEQVESIISSNTNTDNLDDNTNELKNKVEILNNDVRILASQFGGIPVRRPKKITPEHETIILSCPNCQALVKCKQKGKPNSMLAVKCNDCGSNLYSIYDNGNFTLKERLSINEIIKCPICTAINTVPIDPFPGSFNTIICETCGYAIHASRTSDGINVGLKLVEPFTLDEVFIKRVQDLMPPQPWPKGAAAAVAKEIGVPQKHVLKAVNELIKRKLFKVQIDGKLFDIAES